MKITKRTSVNASCDHHGECACKDHKKKAIKLIQAAMDELSLVENDPVCVDSISNLSFVYVDLLPENHDDGTQMPESVEEIPTLNNEGMLEN